MNQPGSPNRVHKAISQNRTPRFSVTPSAAAPDIPAPTTTSLPHRKDGYALKRFYQNVCLRLSQSRKQGTRKIRQIAVRTKSSSPKSSYSHASPPLMVTNSLLSLSSSSMNANTAFVLKSYKPPSDLRRTPTRSRTLTRPKPHPPVPTSPLEKWKVKTMSLIAAIQCHNSTKPSNSRTSSLTRTRSRSLVGLESSLKNYPTKRPPLKKKNHTNSFKRYGVMAQDKLDDSFNFIGPVPPLPRWPTIPQETEQHRPETPVDLPGTRSAEGFKSKLRSKTKSMSKSKSIRRPHFSTIAPITTPATTITSAISPLPPKLTLRLDRAPTDFNELWKTIGGDNLNIDPNKLDLATPSPHKVYPSRARSLMKPAVRKFNKPLSHKRYHQISSIASPDSNNNSDLTSLFDLYAMSEDAYECINRLGNAPPSSSDSNFFNVNFLGGFPKLDLSLTMPTGFTRGCDESTGSETSAESPRSLGSMMSMSSRHSDYDTDSAKSFSSTPSADNNLPVPKPNKELPLPTESKIQQIPSVKRFSRSHDTISPRAVSMPLDPCKKPIYNEKIQPPKTPTKAPKSPTKLLNQTRRQPLYTRQHGDLILRKMFDEMAVLESNHLQRKMSPPPMAAPTSRRASMTVNLNKELP
ncbi:hypothetical protein NADFUDRAFT_84592, partial [Nadsonia fulvescens var. elongata DSM 6958]